MVIAGLRRATTVSASVLRGCDRVAATPGPFGGSTSIRSRLNPLAAVVALAIAGYSFGAAVALRVALKDPKIHSLILVAPPTALFDFEALARFDRPALVIAGQLDAWVDRATVSGLVQAAADGHFDVIVGSDHVFTRGLTELGKRIADWLERRQGLSRPQRCERRRRSSTAPRPTTVASASGGTVWQPPLKPPHVRSNT